MGIMRKFFNLLMILILIYLEICKLHIKYSTQYESESCFVFDITKYIYQSKNIMFYDHKFLLNGSTIVIEMFFKAISQFKPDLVIITGVHLLEFQVYITLIFHLTLRSFYLHSNIFYYIRLLFFVKYWNYYSFYFINKFSFNVFYILIIPHVDSLGINEQELAFLSHVAGGPHMDEYPVQAGTVHAHKYFIYIRKHSSGKCCGNSTSEIIKINIKLVYFSLKQLYNALSTTKYLYIVYLYALLFRLLKCLTGCFAPLVVIEVILRQKTMATVSSESTFIISNISVSIKNHLHHDFMPFSKLAAYKYRYYLHKNLLNYEIIILL
uniref:Uncharacterized protein n=1 Tax=Heterorhabditis bacteriophora TaxID=37862 RepID=A0A1I7X594_HETBA